MNLRYKTYRLSLKHPFTIAQHSRSYTPIVLAELEHQGVTGYGEASLPPYLAEDTESVIAFLRKIEPDKLNIDNLHKSIRYIDSVDAYNTAAKACLDIALHDLWGKIHHQACYRMFQSNPEKMPPTSITIGMDSEEVLIQKVKEAEAFSILKIKLGSERDKEIIESIRKVSDKPLYIDANQGWTDLSKTLDFIHWLKEQKVVLIEQPFFKNDLDKTARLKEKSPLPLFADESCQRLHDINLLKDVFDGINIKLMKSSGMYEAHQMIERARALNMQVMIGCMTETSCAISAAAALAPLCDYCDLDGPWLVQNNPFNNLTLHEGKIVLKDTFGLGL